MKIGVISDTHDQDLLIEKSVQCFNDEKVDLVVHCGDWVSPFILYSFKELRVPIKGVFGNNDGDKFRHVVFGGKFGLDLQYEDRFLELEIEGRLIAVFHGDYRSITHGQIFHLLLLASMTHDS
jgi:uncharacterized protein